MLTIANPWKGHSGFASTEARAYSGQVTLPSSTAPINLVGALADATSSDAALRRFLHGLPGVDQVGERGHRGEALSARVGSTRRMA